MKLFSCPNCSGRLYFENAACLRCGTNVAYRPFGADFAPVPSPGIYNCANAAECACNWAVDAEGDLCAACRLTRTIPDLSVEGNRHRWIKVEAAKKRAVYSLMAFGLDISPKAAPNDEFGIAVDLLADPASGGGPGGERILTGHDNGNITINVAEADAPEREKMRIAMGERYRTLLGHFRHELGHYYWDRLVRDDREWLGRFRALFGDETADYMAALNRHYAQGAPLDWQQRHVSPYAAAHPWEDWAEHWAHYIHITDTLEMVAALNFPLGRLDAAGAKELPPNEANYADRTARRDAEPAELLPGDFDDMLKRWLVLSEASNAINRCMGLPDLYPFVISDVAAEKLRFVHELLGEQAGKKLAAEAERRVA
jgi:hypothetical protein